MIKVMNASEAISPMVKQYQDIKSQYKDAILFFRLGDFYEMFNDDAKTASRELDLTLTGRGEGEKRMPMCGIPYHAAENYIAKLLSRGYKIAICDQVEDPRTAKGVVKREVTRLITPGTVQETKMLDEKQSNYLLALSFTKSVAGIAWVDSTTGEFKVTEVPINALAEEVDRVSPSEILVPDLLPEEALGEIEKLRASGFYLTTYKDIYDLGAADKKLREHFKVRSLESFGLSGYEPALCAAQAILDYLNSTRKGPLGQMNMIQPYQAGDFMMIDSATRRNLELMCTARDGSAEGSLLWAMDRTVTPMGARLMKKWILMPLKDANEINIRLDAVEELKNDLIRREDLKKALSDVSDIERLVGKAATGTANGRDLVALKDSLLRIPEIKKAIKPLTSEIMVKVKELDDNSNVNDLISSSIVSDPPHTLKEGGLIRDGYDSELDGIRGLTRNNKEWIAQLELSERQRAGIKSLKVGYTSVFGYYIEISKSNLGLVPSDYIRKQTLVNCERFITPELKDREALILNAEEKMFELEYRVFCIVRDKVASHTAALQKVSRALAELDVILSFAAVAAEMKYSRPRFSKAREIKIKGGRHPVVERMLSGSNQFVPNSTDMDETSSRFVLITGPNMAGKSTYMRQVALICLLAQMGSFVPAEEAKLHVIDRIFTRIGALDDIYSGQSTFMVEMTETANIINNATSESLIILDEIGRGTSTFDGMSIAASVAEHIHDKVRAFTLFATHYHEITQLADRNPGMKNLSTLVKKEGDDVVFLHKIADGPADQSYGIEVARLAGLPESIISRAKEVYNTLEMVEKNVATSKKPKASGGKEQTCLF